MRPIKTLKDALDTIERGFIVDQADNRLPYKVVEALQNRSGRQSNGGYFRSHCRYEKNREIWWFCE